MLETWEQGQVDRLERRIDQLERKGWERSYLAFRLVVYGFAAAMIALAVFSIAHSAHA